MAYMSQERKKELAPRIKAVLKKFNMKGSIGVQHHTGLVVKLKSGVIDFGENNCEVNNYHIDAHWDGVQKDFLNELNDAMNVGNFDKSDYQSDYFHIGWFSYIWIGSYDKHYTVTEA